MPKTYFKQQRDGFKTKYISKAFRDTNRKVFTEWAKDAAKGYNLIVSNWKSVVRFTPDVTYHHGVWSAKVLIGGSARGQSRFRAVDFGADRGQKKMSVPDTQEAVPELVLPKSPGRLKLSYESFKIADEYQAEVAKLEKEHKALERKAQKREEFGAWAPMRKHNAKTGEGGIYGGSGSYIDKQIAFVKEWTLGDIKARNFSAGLYMLAQTGSDTFGVSNIWPRNMRWTHTARRAYDTGVREANRAGKRTG